MRFWALLSLSVAALAAPREARATACCGEASGLGDRLLDAEIAAVSVRVLSRGRFGSFGGDSRFRALPDEISDAELGLSFSTAARVTDRLEMGSELTGRLSFRTVEGESKIGGGLGDIHTHARFAVVKATEHRFVPGVYALTGVVVPTGVPASRSEAGTLSTDVTGQGNAEVIAGLSLEKTYESVIFLRTEASVGFFFPETIDANTVARSPRLSVAGLLGPVLDPVVLGVGAAYEAEAAPPAAIAGSAGRSRLEVVVAGSVNVDVKTSLVASVRAPLPVAGFGTNETASVSASVGARFGFF